MNTIYQARYDALCAEHRALLEKKNEPLLPGNGVFIRYRYPVITAAHTPLFWRYDLDPSRNPFLMERLGVNSCFNCGAIEFEGKICLMVRVEGYDRKSFFAIARSDNGIDNFRFDDLPVLLPETAEPDTNVYDMRLTRHEDGWIYGLFCTERRSPTAKDSDAKKGHVQIGIVRTHDLVHFERLPDLKTCAEEQRNVVLHPEFVNGKYALYTRPFSRLPGNSYAPGIGFGLVDSMENAVMSEPETIIDANIYHSVKDAKNGMGAAPIKTDLGWISIAHGVRYPAGCIRYVLYAFMADPEKPWVVTHRPGGYIMAPEGDERVGDVSNVLFTNGVIKRDNGDILIYYASSDTRLHVAKTTVAQLTDYCLNTPEDALRSFACVEQRRELIERNLKAHPELSRLG